jgi:ATP-dependent helicase YprA (DUF1998 family)
VGRRSALWHGDIAAGPKKAILREAPVDSRSRAEQIARELRSLQVTTFVTHSSLSQEERRQAEAAFAGREDCVIVAPAAANLRQALDGLLDQALTDDYPAHPKFEAEIRKRNV